MLHVMDLKSVLARLVIFSAGLSILVYYAARLAIPDWDLPPYRIITIISITTPLLIAACTTNIIWRPLWKIASRLDGSIYPDLNGTWEGTVKFTPSTDGSTSTPLPFKARIKHSMLNIFIDFHGETFKSITLTAVPRTEQGQHHLYYVYRAEPQDPERGPYEGTTRLRVQFTGPPDSRVLSLSGTYYTTRKTNGTIQLTQVTKDPDQDVSYY